MSSLPTSQLDPSSAAVIRDMSLGQINFVRGYVHELLAATPRDLWYSIPAGAVTSVAWQVGHLAVSQYGLLLFRQRGRAPEDLDLIPGRFRKKYGRGSVPIDGPEGQPTIDELLERLEAVYVRAMDELRRADPARLLEPVDMPYAVYPNKLGALLFCPLHEQLHAGQIGSLRRAHRLEPVR